MLNYWSLACAFLLVLGGPARAQPASVSSRAPSFSCAAARTQVERAICARSELAALDRTMADLFAVSKTSAFGTGPSNQLPAQRAALREIRACEKPDGAQPREKCIATAYARRNAELAVAVLVARPDVALPVLRQLDPGVAPILEAVALWAAEPVDADWAAPQRAAAREKIATRLQPYMKALQTDESQSFGRSILTDPGPEGIAVHGLDDLFVSDRHFAAFLNVLGPYLPELAADSLLSNDRRTLPCAAIVRHPALLQATGSVFGSTMDNFVFDADCEQTLPPAPALDRLAGKLRARWPECDGTIRFAAYRDFETALQLARLGQSEHARDRSDDRREGVMAADLDAARSELDGYYRNYLGKSAIAAQTMARDAISSVLSSAHECGA